MRLSNIMTVQPVFSELLGTKAYSSENWDVWGITMLIKNRKGLKISNLGKSLPVWIIQRLG